jgi:hypothetical protein
MMMRVGNIILNELLFQNYHSNTNDSETRNLIY